jgi:hypothetical protein
MAGILGYIPQCDLKKGLEYSIKWYKVYNNANFKN